MKLYVEERGHGPQTLVLLHGWLRSMRVWDALVPGLSKVARCVAIDLPGFGRSPVIEGRGDHAFYGGHVLEALDEMGLSEATVVGHGLGGAVGCWLALERPKLVQRVVGVSPTLLRSPVLGLRGRIITRKPGGRLAMKLAGPRVVRRILKPHYHEAERLTDGVVAEVHASLRRPGAAAMAHNALRTDLDGGLAEVVRDLSVPVTLIWGQNDRVQPLDVARELVERIPDCVLKQIPNAGYQVIETRPRSVARYLCEAVGIALPEGIPDGHLEGSG